MGDLFRVGDKVWSVEYGWGEVININRESGHYPVFVTYSDGFSVGYSTNGTRFTGQKRVLFFDEIIIPEKCLNRPQWRAEKGERYLYVNEVGTIHISTELKLGIDNKRFMCGNYFETREEAEKSSLYKLLNGKGAY